MTNSRTKGHGFERALCKEFGKRFPGLAFARSPGSGAFGTRTNAGHDARAMMAGDIIVPPGFRFTIEAKKGYGNADLSELLDNSGATSRLVNDFCAQALRNSEISGLAPMVVWKPDRRAAIAICMEELPIDRFHFGQWRVYSFCALLAQPDAWWFGVYE